MGPRWVGARGRCNNSLMEHRWGKRIEVEVPVRVMHAVMSRCGAGRLRNISLGGALIISALDSNVGACVQVSIPMSSGAGPCACVIDAYLVRKSDQALAVEWAEFAPAEVIDLVRALPLLTNARNSSLTLSAPDEFTASNIAQAC